MKNISVAICTFNGEAYIQEQLESIVRQSVKPDEIIVCDDGSSDSTVDRVREVLTPSGIDHRIYRNDERLGVRKNFDKCIALCRGEIIFCSDQDDVWLDRKIETYVEAFESNPSAVLVYADAMIVDESGETVSDSCWRMKGLAGVNLSMDEYCDKVLREWFVSGYNLAIRSNLYQEIRPLPGFSFHDAWFAICAPLYGTVVMLPMILAKYRRHGKNVTRWGPSTQVGSTAGGSLGSNSTRQPALFERDQFAGVSSRFHFNRRFLEIHEKALARRENEAYRRKCEESVRFFGDLASCHPDRLIHSYRVLWGHAINGNFGRWRGGIKEFTKDHLFLLGRRLQASSNRA